MSWSPQQDTALKAVSSWIRNPGRQQVFRLFGYAGTGKTTLARELAANARGQVLFGAFTGKAAHVLNRKGCHGASTIHSMIYKVDERSGTANPRFILDRNSVVSEASLVIIDEVSMVDETIGQDLLSFGKPVLVLGDPAQLPPVKGAGFFTEHEPDIMLTEVHRQARESAIVRIATQIREGERLEYGEYGDCRVVKKADINADQVLAADQVLVGKNATRVSYNRRIRELKGITSVTPVKGERLICLKNDRGKKLLNGQLWNVVKVPKPNLADEQGDLTRLIVRDEDAGEEGSKLMISVKNVFWRGDEANVPWEALRGTDQFTFGYALTVHKSQGSQWNNVMVFDEASFMREEADRWRYTAVTRAAQNLTMVV